MISPSEHDLYTKGVLKMCRICGRCGVELYEPCEPRIGKKVILDGLIDGLNGFISEHGIDAARRYWSAEVIAYLYGE